MYTYFLMLVLSTSHLWFSFIDADKNLHSSCLLN
jgi:hypothetical protein